MAPPRKYKTASELDKAVEGYFAYYDGIDKSPTWANMLNYLSISDDTLLNYRTKEEYIKEGYSEVIKRAERLHSDYWQQLAINKPNLQSFCIFELKQPHNGGFIDRPAQSTEAMQVEISVKGLDNHS